MATITRRVDWWVVYRMAVKGAADGVNAVCTQDEWDAMELARPGHHTLVRGRIANEAEAERLARGTSGDTVRKGLPIVPPAPIKTLQGDEVQSPIPDAVLK